jgi:hypothetical protein
VAAATDAEAVAVARQNSGSPSRRDRSALKAGHQDRKPSAGHEQSGKANQDSVGQHIAQPAADIRPHRATALGLAWIGGSREQFQSGHDHKGQAIWMNESSTARFGSKSNRSAW